MSHLNFIAIFNCTQCPLLKCHNVGLTRTHTHRAYGQVVTTFTGTLSLREFKDCDLNFCRPVIHVSAEIHHCAVIQK